MDNNLPDLAKKVQQEEPNSNQTVETEKTLKKSHLTLIITLNPTITPRRYPDLTVITGGKHD